MSCFEMLSSRPCSRRGVGVTRRTSRDCREDQEAREDAVLPQAVASLHLGHLLGYQGVRGQQQHWKRPSGPGPESGFYPGSAQIQLGRVPEGLRTQRHPSLTSYTNPVAGSRPVLRGVFISEHLRTSFLFFCSLLQQEEAIKSPVDTPQSVVQSLASVSRSQLRLTWNPTRSPPSPVFRFFHTDSLYVLTISRRMVEDRFHPFGCTSEQLKSVSLNEGVCRDH